MIPDPKKPDPQTKPEQEKNEKLTQDEREALKERNLGNETIGIP